jgi:exonuclease SbcC
MIVKSMHAENVLRYAQLRLTDLPQRGLIGVSGPNESGKTTIAEIMCLALFGRSFSLDESDIAKHIKWGEFSGSVRLEFMAKDGHDYQVVRSFDADGNYTAQLRRVGEEDPLARGVAAVNQSVVQLGGFTYKRFIDSFYLAQRNIAAPHILKETAKALAGVDTFEHISAEFEQDIQTLQTALVPLDSQIADARRQRTDLDIQADVLPHLKVEHQTHAHTIAQHEAENEKRQGILAALQTATTQVAEQVGQIAEAGVDTSFAQWQQHTDHLGQAIQAVNEASQTAEPGAAGRLTGRLESWLDDLRGRLGAFEAIRQPTASYRRYLVWLAGDGDKPPSLAAEARSLPEQQTQLRSQESRGRRRRVGTTVGFVPMFLIMAGVWAALWFVTQAPDHVMGQWLMTNVHLSSEHSTSLFVVAAGLSAAGVFCVVWLSVLSGKTRNASQRETRLRGEQEEVRNTVQRIDALPSRTLPDVVTELRRYDDTALSDAVARFAIGPGAVFLDAEAAVSYVTPLQAALRSCQENADAIQERLEGERRQASTTIGMAQQEVNRLDQDIAAEEARLNKATQLDRQVTAMQQQITEQTRQIDIRRIAQKLLAGSHNRLLGRFNLEMRHVVSKIMPLLTDGRYETLQVDRNLDMHVLSNEKGNFIALHELSGGADNQVMLAVRLALSQALISTAVGGAECIILDEPFAFFDERRTQKTLEILPKVSDDIAQIWIIAQRFSDANSLTLHLCCAPDSDVLIASGA